LTILYKDWLDYDPSRSCAKCGSRNIATYYHGSGFLHGLRGISGFLCSGIITSDDADREHLFRRCRDCGYSWIELPGDATWKDR